MVMITDKILKELKLPQRALSEDVVEALIDRIKALEARLEVAEINRNADIWWNRPHPVG
jgi:hypothetical protein